MGLVEVFRSLGVRGFEFGIMWFLFGEVDGGFNEEVVNFVIEIMVIGKSLLSV